MAMVGTFCVIDYSVAVFTRSALIFLCIWTSLGLFVAERKSSCSSFLMAEDSIVYFLFISLMESLCFWKVNLDASECSLLAKFCNGNLFMLIYLDVMKIVRSFSK